MQISRRSFLAAASMAAGALAPMRALGGVFDKADAFAGLGWDAFYPYVTTGFEFRSDTCGPFTMTLTGIRELSPPDLRQKKGPSRCFALFFEGPAVEGACQDTFRVDHFALGSFELFATLATDTSEQMRLTAVINRI